MSINQGDNGGGNPSNGQSKFASYPPAERVSRLHKALVSDEVFSSLIPNDFNAFVDEYSKPERMQKLHTALSQDEVFRNLVPARYEDAIEWMGFTTKPEPMGKPSPTTQMQSGRGGVDSGAGSQSGLQSSSQRRITVDDIGVAGVGGTEPEFNYEVDRQAAEEQSESLRQQRINQGVNQINILVNAAGKEGRGLIEKGLSEGLSQREYQKLYDVLEGTQFRDYISRVNPMTDLVSPNAFRQIFADGITAGGSDAGFSTVTKRGDFDKLSEQANADAVNQWLSAFDSRMQDKVGERAYRAAKEQARATYGEKAESVINNAERLIAHQSISEEESKAAALVRELNDLVSSGRELSNEEIARAAELDRQIKSAEVELGKMGTLYDPITGQFIPQMRAPEFAAEVSQREEELSEVKDLDLLKDMRRRAYFAYNEYRKKAGDKDFLYEWIPGQDVDVDRMRSAWKEFSALNRVIELNIDPATISREGENLAALRTGFMGSPNLESNRSVVEGVIDAFRRSGLTPTKEQEDRLQKSFGEQIAESIGASTNIMLKMGAEMALTRGVRGALGLNSYANAFRRVLSATRLGAKAPKAVNISSKILGGVFDVGQSAGIYSVAGAGAATGAGEEIAQKIIDLFTKGKAGRIAKLISGSIGEVTAEYIGEYANALAELGIDNLDEAFRETFGRDPESAMDKLLLTLATIAPFAGVSAIGREFTDSVEKYAKSQPASDVQREVLSVIDVLREADAKRKGGAAATTAAPEVAPETAPEAAPTPTAAPALADVESTAKALSGKTAGLIKEPTIEERVADLQKGNSVEFTYEKKSDVPLELRDKISRWGEVGGKKFVAVRISEIEANYLLSKNNPKAISELYHAAKAKPEGERTAQEASLIESVENLLKPEPSVVSETPVAETTSGNVQDTGQGQAVDTQVTRPEGVAAPVDSVDPTTPELATPVATTPAAPTTNPALADVESTAKALEGVDFSSVVGEIQMPSQDLVDSTEEEVQAKIDAYEREFAEKRAGRKDLTEDEVADVLADAISDGTYVEPSQLYAERDALLGQQVDVFRGNIRNILMSAGFDTDQAESIMFDMGIPKKSLAFVQQGGLDSLGEKVRARDKDFSRKLQLAILKQIYESKNLDYYGSTSSPLSGMSESQKAEYARQANVIARGVMSVFQYIENLSYTPDAKYVAESYHAAKAKPEAERTAQEVSLIESVESLLNQETDATKEQGAAPVLVGGRPQVSEEVRGQDTQGGEVTGEGEVKTKEGEPVQETEPVQEGKVAKIVEELRSDPNVTEVHVSGNDIVYSKKDKNGNPRYYEKIGGGRSNQLSKTDFEFKREIAMDNATSIAEAGIPLEGEPAFLEGEDQTSLNVLDNNLVFTTTGTFPESTNEILGEEKSESETLTDEEVESAVSGDGIPLTSVSALSPKEKSEALKKANERLEASKKRLKESWNKYRGISMSTGIIITPQSVKQNVDTMFEVFRDISLYAKDWALQKAFQGVEFSKINFMEFKRENRFLFTNAGARKAVGGRFFDEAGGSMAELAFDDGVKMALDLNYDGVQSPDEMTELQRASRGEVGSVTDVILEQFNRDSKPVSAPYRERILNAFRALNSALDYNANVKKSVIKLRDMIAKTGVPNFSISEFFEKLQFAFQPGSKIDLKFKKFKQDVYGNISSIQKEYLDLIILYDNVISLEDAIAERRTKISEFDNDLVSNHDFEAKNLRKTLNDYAAGRKVPKKVKEKIDAYLASTGQTESEFKSKIRSIEGKRVLDGKISPNYQHPYNLKKDSAQAQIEVVRKKLKEKYGDAEGEQIFSDLRSRADKYFDFNRSLLKDRLDAGQISIHIYEELKDRKYVPRLWEEVDLDNELSGNPLYDVMKISGDGNAGGYVSVKMPVLEKKKSLVGGSRVTQKAIVYSDTLMHMNVAMTIRAIENHRLMQFVVNNVIPSSDAMVDFLLSQESKAKGRPLTSSEEREIRSQSQNVYELKRIGTNKDGSPKFEPPLNGFVTFVFSDGDVTRAFASRKVGSTDFMGEFKMKSGRRNRETLRLISNIMGTSLLKMSAVGLNVAFFIKQMTSMDVIHQISVLPGVKFVPSSYARRVIGSVGLVSGKVFNRAVYTSRVAFANYFNGTMPKEKASKFERAIEDAIAHGLDFGTGILGHSNVPDFETGAKSNKLDLAFDKALDFLQAGGRDSELATRIVSWNILTASEMKKMKKKLKRDLTPEEISSIKRNAAKEVSNALNYSVRGAILDVVDSFSPFFAATVNAQKAHLRYLPGKLGRIAGGEPMSAKRKAEYMANVGQIIFFSTLSSLWMFAKDDEDERDGIIPIGASGTRDAYVIPLNVTTDKDGKRVRSAMKISLDKTAGFYQLIGKAIAQSIYYGGEDNWSTTGRRPAYPVTAKDFAVSAFQTIPAVGSTPPLLSSLVSLLGNYDLYRFQDIYKGNKDARSDLQATQHTRAIFRKMARFVDPATEAMLGTNVSAQQLESAVGKVIALNNPFSQAVTWGFAQFMPEDMRGKGEKELSDLSKAMLGNMYIEARRARQDIPAGKIGAAMANIESLRTVDDVMSEIRSLTTSELNANYSDIAASISKAASTTTRMDAGYPTSRQVLDLIEADGVDYAAGARVISAYQSDKSDVVRDLMSLPAGRFGPNDSFFKSLVGPNNEREDIAYEIKDDREAKLEDNYVPSNYYFDELVNMGLSKDAAFELSESLSKLKAAESK